MTSIISLRRSHTPSTSDRTGHYNLYDKDDDETSNRISSSLPTGNGQVHLTKDHVQSSTPINHNTMALSCNGSSSSNNNRLRHLCARLKRRFTLTRQHRTRSEGFDGQMQKRPMLRIGKYQSFSSSPDDSSPDFDWPNFEQVYDSIPPCLINALPGLDDFSPEENDDLLSSENVTTDENELDCNTDEQMIQFQQCLRGGPFRRNAVCRKIDKTQYKEQLTTFIQQIMIEKLMRTWT